MTGFGEASALVDGVHYFLEVRSLNNKYFKANIRMPEHLQGLEPVIETALRRILTRGTVTVIGKCTDQSASAAHQINKDALRRYISELRSVEEVASGAVPLDTSSLLALPGVLTPPDESEGRLNHARDVYLKLVEEATAHLLSMRRREGAMLASELMAHHDVIEQALERIRERAPTVVADFEDRLRNRVQTMLDEAGVAAEVIDVIREVAIYAEKSDIAEEIARLGAHLAQFRDLISNHAGDPVGRTLDFLSQEMLREANTVASKSSDAEVTRHTVAIKGAIDRIKEQVQNVE